MVRSDSATNVGKAPSGGAARPSGAGVRQRAARSPSAGAPAKRNTAGAAATSNAGMWRMFTEDSPGLKVDPVVVLVASLLFIASVFMLHIWGKFNRA
eukprot:m.18799 g.18799  ORF g.18799 m.18799 type:complete len:97 (-) comp3698_c0_seq1:297-587(-)